MLKKEEKMKELEATEQTLEKVKIALQRVKSGELTAEELEDLVSNAQALYERAVVLRFKAYELQILGKNIEVFSDKEVGFDYKTADKTADKTFNKTTVENEKNETDVVPVIDPVVTEKITEKLKDQDTVTAILNNPTPTIDFSIFDNIEEDSKKEPEIDLSIKIERVEETPKVESNPSMFDAAQVAANSSLDFFKKMKSQSDASSFPASKLTSLVNAFSFAERLQIVNECFEGSNEAYTNFIEEADVFDSRDKANTYLHVLVQKHKISTESESFTQLVLTLDRKYV